MKRATLLALVVSSLGFGCRTAHLGPGTGRAYHRALAAQAENRDSEATAALDARDAKMALERHRSTRGPGAAARGASGAMPLSGGGSSSSSSSSSGSGGASSFKLEGK